jgi:hypothetical protein
MKENITFLLRPTLIKSCSWLPVCHSVEAITSSSQAENPHFDPRWKHQKSHGNKATWALSWFKVSLSLVEYSVKNFRKGFICRKSCNERMAYCHHGLHTGYISLCCRMDPAFPILFLWLIIASAKSSKMFHFPKLVSNVWNLQFSLVTIVYLARGAI